MPHDLRGSLLSRTCKRFFSAGTLIIFPSVHEPHGLNLSENAGTKKTGSWDAINPTRLDTADESRPRCCGSGSVVRWPRTYESIPLLQIF